MNYGFFILLGALAAWLVRSRLRDPGAQVPGTRLPLAAAAILGGALGAYLFELPADLFGWAWRPTGAEPLGGRTVLGGILGGWIAVEIAKRALGMRQATGDGVAAPLAAALAIGRLGCVQSGCCAGAVCPVGSWWEWLAVSGRFPAALVESAFHALALGVLLLADRYGWWRRRRLYVYLLAYAAVRFGLEGGRANPPLVLGLTWFQILAVLVLIVAVAGWIRYREPETSAG